LDLPSTLAGVESLLAQGMFSGKTKVNGDIDSSLLAGLGSLGGLGAEPNAAVVPSCLPDSAPVQIPGLTMGELRKIFSNYLAMDSPSSKAELEQFLSAHGLLPVNVKQEQDDGALETMRSMEHHLPEYSSMDQ